jgi:hypothetical protein
LGWGGLSGDGVVNILAQTLWIGIYAIQEKFASSAAVPTVLTPTSGNFIPVAGMGILTLKMSFNTQHERDEPK